VVVGFHTQHSHLGWVDYGDRDHVDEAIAVAREFLTERMVVITWYSDGEPETATRVWPAARVFGRLQPHHLGASPAAAQPLGHEPHRAVDVWKKSS